MGEVPGDEAKQIQTISNPCLETFWNTMSDRWPLGVGPREERDAAVGVWRKEERRARLAVSANPFGHLLDMYCIMSYYQ